MIIDILTIFPNLLASPLEEGIIHKARSAGLAVINTVNIRDFAAGRHQVTDDRPFGGGEGMVMKAEPLALAVESLRQRDSLVILLSPQGGIFDQAAARELARRDHLILVCGRYEGVDERFCQRFVEREYSIGDYILSGGELAAMVITDAVTRLIPGVLGCADSALNDTFSRPLLKYPQYTRPALWRGMETPAVLLSGDHEKIADYRFIQAARRTAERRPELLRRVEFAEREKKILRDHGLTAGTGDWVLSATTSRHREGENEHAGHRPDPLSGGQ
ncbi:MAG: tRNA (guanosine(37)-N1)-methyltransferase TrmD [Desulfobulbaceae bacterium]|jgi:tRNA (guanine37-N1)-methyltransferase|nr:tRNA (guanosine(37)-N1)-methyltransferase TrmD [Desulfobulbaceae bacterium]